MSDSPTNAQLPGSWCCHRPSSPHTAQLCPCLALTPCTRLYLPAAGAKVAANAVTPSASLIKAVMLGGAATITGFEADTGLPVDPPPSFRQGFGRVWLGALRWTAWQGLWLRSVVGGCLLRPAGWAASSGGIYPALPTYTHTPLCSSSRSSMHPPHARQLAAPGRRSRKPAAAGGRSGGHWAG